MVGSEITEKTAMIHVPSTAVSARQSLPCYTAVARLGFKRRATAVVKLNLIRSIELGKAVALRLKRALVSNSLFPSHHMITVAWVQTSPNKEM